MTPARLPKVPRHRRQIINRECWRLANGRMADWLILRAQVTARVATGMPIEYALRDLAKGTTHG